MNLFARCFTGFALLCSTLCLWPKAAQAQTPITYLFTGEITGVEDQYNWFNSTYTVGQTVSGTFTYFNGGYTPGVLFGYPNSMYYGYGSHAVHPDFSLQAGGRQVHQQSDAFSLTVTNDGPAPYNNAVGDTIDITPDIAYPSFFNDPANTPGFEDYYAFANADLKLYDATGTALASAALPLALPDLSVFSSSTGSILISDGNGSYDEFARTTFRLTSLQATPEPGSVALLVGMGLSGAGFLARRKKAHKAA